MDDLYEAVRRPFVEVAGDLAGSLIYLDAGAGEVASTSLGLSFLFGKHLMQPCAKHAGPATHVSQPPVRSPQALEQRMFAP